MGQSLAWRRSDPVASGDARRMIGRLTGRIVECRPDHVLLDVSGVGYLLHIPLSTYYRLHDAADGAVTLQVHTHVREDVLQLYGFSSAAEKSTFELLIGISGVGPRLALAFLSGIGVDELRQSVYREDRARLQKIPGVGRKTAERVLLELRDRIGREPARAQQAGAPPAVAGPEPGRVDLRQDAISALVNLGYSRDAAARSVDEALDRTEDEAASLEALLKESLGRLSR